MAKKSSIVVEQFQLSADPTAPASGYSALYPRTDGKWYFRNSSGAAVDLVGESKKEILAIACSDLTTALTTGTSKAHFRMPWAGTLTAVKASVVTAPTGSTILIDVNETGTTVLSTKLMIDASEKTSATATTAYVISDSALADDAEITIDIDQIGSTIAGAGLVVYLYITRT